MSAYDNDPRVTAHEDGSFTVVCTRRIRPLAHALYAVETADGMECLDTHEDADEAIRSLIGDPQ